MIMTTMKIYFVGKKSLKGSRDTVYYLIGRYCIKKYCGIILVRKDECFCIVNILLVRGDVILWVTGLSHYNALLHKMFLGS